MSTESLTSQAEQPKMVAIKSLGPLDSRDLTIGTLISDIGCQWRLREPDYDGRDYYVTSNLCGKTPTIKSKFIVLFCQEHLVQAETEYALQVEQEKVKRMIVKINSTEFELKAAEAIAVQVPRRRQNRFTGAFGKTWDTLGRTERGERVLVDTTWGHFGYFRRNNVQYRVNLRDKDSEKVLARLKAKGGVSV